MAKKVIVGGRIESKEVGGIVTGAAEILDDSKGKKQSVINQETDNELARLDQSKQDNLTFDNVPTEGSENPVKSGGLYTAQQAILLAIAAINELIPSAASVLNQLADKAFVNSSVSTNTATFRGTSAAGLNEQQFLAWANGLEHDLNDYVFWQTSDAAGNTLFRRYKWNGTEWAYEYTLNNSTFTAEQWEAIQSGITALLVAKLRALPTAQELIQSFDGKQDALTFDDTPTLGSNNPVKSSGIYNVIKAITDLIPAEATAQNQLADKADVAAKIVAAIPSWKGQYDALTDLQAVTGTKAGDMGCVKTTDSDGHAVLTFYQYSAQGSWVVYYTLRHYAQNKPATTGTTGDYPYNGMGRVELPMNVVNGVNTLTQDMFYKGEVGSRVPNTNTIFVIQHDYELAENITIPEGCVLEFDGGSLNYGKIILQSNTTINGNGCICKVPYNKETGRVCHYNFISAQNASKITINNLIIKGIYDGESDVTPYDSANTDAKNQIFMLNVNYLTINGLIITNMAQDNSGPEGMWDAKDVSDMGFAPIKLTNCTNVSLTNCKERLSAGEGWEFNYCNNLVIDNISMVRKYGVSEINICGCNNTKLTNSTFIQEIAEGQVVNFTCSNSVMSNCYVEGSPVDFGNEFANKELGYISSFCCENNLFLGNHLVNAGFINNTTAKFGYGKTESEVKQLRCVDNIQFVNNTLIREIGGPYEENYNTIFAINTGFHHRVGTLLISGNTMMITGGEDYVINDSTTYAIVLNSAGSNTSFTDKIIIKNNIIMDNSVLFDDEHKSASIADFLSRNKRPTWLMLNAVDNVIVENNDVKAPFGITDVLDSRNFSYYGKTTVDGRTIKGNNFVVETSDKYYYLLSNNTTTINLFRYCDNICSFGNTVGYFLQGDIIDVLDFQQNDISGDISSAIFNSIHYFANSGNSKLNLYGISKLNNGELVDLIPDTSRIDNTIFSYSTGSPRTIITGYPVFNRGTNRPMWFNKSQNRYVGPDNRAAEALLGYSNSRPTLNNGTDIGYMYFDRTLQKPIFWKGDGWIDATGQTV